MFIKTTYIFYFLSQFLLNMSMGKRTKSLSHVLAIFKNIGPKMCEQRCSKMSDCNAITFKGSSIYCELVKDTLSGKYVEDETFNFLDKSAFRIENNVCWPNPCSRSKICIISKSSEHICVDFETKFTQDDFRTAVAERSCHRANVALNKPAFQYPDDLDKYGGLHRPHWAIDGNDDTFSHTTNFNASIHKKLYWMVDLEDEVLIHQVLIINRKAFGARLHDVDINIGATTARMNVCGHFVGPGTNGQKINITCNGLLLGRYVKIVFAKPKTGAILHLAEVLVFAYV